MFLNKLQRTSACWILLRLISVDFAHLVWRPPGVDHDIEKMGPTGVGLAKLRSVLEGDGHSLSRGETIMLRAAFDFWNGAGHMHIHDVIDHLQENEVKAIGELIAAVASGPSGIEVWLTKWGSVV